MARRAAVILASFSLLFEHADMEASWDIRAPLLQLSVAAGEPASLTCRDPPPGKRSWFRKQDANSFPTQMQNTKRTMTDSNGTLHFSYVKRNDTGVFMCGAREAQSMTFGSKVIMTVQKSTDTSTDVKPKVMFHSGAIKSEVGGDIKLECFFSGRPAPNISWTHSNAILESGGRILVSHRSVVIRNVTEADHGTYTCTGRNVAGTAAALVTVDVPQTTSTNVSGTVLIAWAVIVFGLGAFVLVLLLWRKMKTTRKQANELSPSEQQEIEDFVVKDG